MREFLIVLWWVVVVVGGWMNEWKLFFYLKWSGCLILI